MDKETRWRQRFENLDRAFLRLASAISDFKNLSVLEKEGMVQRFEYTFELTWKTLKDYLEAKEVDATFPRDVIKKAFQYGVIQDGEVWMDMLEKRNLLAHTYNEERFNFAVNKIKDEYYAAIAQVHGFLEAKR
ncbi:MAG: nucleotidyltransferase substrate binding protein [Peptococcaceae bacterium]|nr:nucleotidyltransferase substrate binding protein [Peptococcaceae bacterium]